LTSVGRNRYKSLNVVEGNIDKCLRTDEPMIFVDHTEVPLPDFSADIRR
ncbi:hypothetical protein T07_4040, partial [Trichinella nelsoni]